MFENEKINTVADLIAADENKSKRVLVQVAAGAIIAIGLLFTGVLNFMLYSRAFTNEMRVLGVIPALLIEGSLAAFLVGNFVWFSHGLQGQLAKIFGWAMFVLVSLNCVIEFNALTNASINSDILRLYAFWCVPIVIPVTIAFWKAVIDADPAIQLMRQRRKIAQALELAKSNALSVALASDASREALTVFGETRADTINRELMATSPAQFQNRSTSPNSNGVNPH